MTLFVSQNESSDRLLVLQRLFKEGCAGMGEVRLGAWRGSAWPVRYYPAYPRAASYVCQGLQWGILRSVGQVVAGFAAIQIPAVNGPVDFAGLPPAGWTNPLSAEPVAAGTLASLGHRYLPPGLLRQFITALLHSAPLTPHQPGFAGRAPRPWYAGVVRSGSGGHTVKPAGTSRT